ncbi:MAG: DNA repair protein RadA [SAR324 cluster bacterium]|nr:DNA repair protein RadA [SAR324 cluster bacterium]
MGYICNECGTKYPKWVGSCSACNNWGTISEDKQPAGDLAMPWSGKNSQLADLKNVDLSNEKQYWQTGTAEFDSVCGGGIVPASIGLLGGEPGVGKSTLILQLIGRLKLIGKKCLYVSGEESVNQIKARANRLTVKQDGILVLIESLLDRVMDVIEKEKPDFVVFDSIQTLYTKKINSSAGSLLQIRECTFFLTQYAKLHNCAFLLIAHVTKEGSIAGPKTIEHMVDYVLYLEGAPGQDYRYLRALKNRFGHLNEVGFFKMTARGLAEVKHPNKIFMDFWRGGCSGSVIFPASEGSRIIFLEIQALVGRHSTTHPIRTTLGIERNRLLILLASLEKYLNLNLGTKDVYLNIAAGVKINDPSVDMAILGAIYSSLKNITFKKPLAMLGEASLTGEFTSPRELTQKLSALEKSGVGSCLFATHRKIKIENNNYCPVANLSDMANAMNRLAEL